MVLFFRTKVAGGGIVVRFCGRIWEGRRNIEHTLHNTHTPLDRICIVFFSSAFYDNDKGCPCAVLWGYGCMHARYRYDMREGERENVAVSLKLD